MKCICAGLVFLIRVSFISESCQNFSSLIQNVNIVFDFLSHKLVRPVYSPDHFDVTQPVFYEDNSRILLSRASMQTLPNDRLLLYLCQ